jgi:hypothetical protein
MFEPKRIAATVAGESVVIRALSARERLSLMSRAAAVVDSVETGFTMMCETVALCVLSLEGKPLFADARSASEIDVDALVQLFNACAEHNGIKAKASAEKNG